MTDFPDIDEASATLISEAWTIGYVASALNFRERTLLERQSSIGASLSTLLAAANDPDQERKDHARKKLRHVAAETKKTHPHISNRVDLLLCAMR